jgi:hypothetical protein
MDPALKKSGKSLAESCTLLLAIRWVREKRRRERERAGLGEEQVDWVTALVNSGKCLVFCWLGCLASNYLLCKWIDLLWNHVSWNSGFDSACTNWRLKSGKRVNLSVRHANN